VTFLIGELYPVMSWLSRRNPLTSLMKSSALRQSPSNIAGSPPMALTSCGTATGACPPMAGWPGGGCSGPAGGPDHLPPPLLPPGGPPGGGGLVYCQRDALSLALTLAGVPIVAVVKLLLVAATVPKLAVPPAPDTGALDGCCTRVEGCCTCVPDIVASGDDEIGDSFFGCFGRDTVTHPRDDTGVNDSGIGVSLICLLSCLDCLVVLVTSSLLSSTVSWSDSGCTSGDGLLSCSVKLNSSPGRS